MASHKRSARQRQQAAFAAQAGDMDDIFAREDRRRQRLDERKDAARRRKACSSKNRYASQAEAKAAIAECEAHGTRGLSCYRCTYCNGWHLTSHPWQD